MKFLFWNVKKNPLGPIVSQIVREHNVEIIILAECSDPDAILVDLNSETEYLFHLTESQGTRVVIYTRFPAEYIETAHKRQVLHDPAHLFTGEERDTPRGDAP